MNSLRTALPFVVAVAALLGGTSALAQRNDAISCPINGREVLPVGSSPTKDLEVGPGKCVVSGAGKYAFKNVKVVDKGALVFDDAAIEFEAESIVVQSGGTMQTGTTVGSPVAISKNQLVVRLVGDRPDGKNPYVPISDDLCTNMTKGIGVQSGGTLSLLGGKGVAVADRRSATVGGNNPGTASWSYLAEPAGPALYQTGSAKIGAPVEKGGELTIYLPVDVSTNWKLGDWIVIATSSFSPFESEFVKIADIKNVAAENRPSGAVTKVTLDPSTPLVHYHFGGKDPGWPGPSNASAGADRNFGVDERAEVGLVSRNVKLTAKVTPWDKATSDTKKDYAWGGEIKVCKGFKKVELEGVEIERFGKETLGSYPFHLHMVGDHADGTLKFNSNSIHHSYNHCIAVHMTNNVTFSNNVCARAIGHLFYEEVPAGHDHETGSVIFDTGVKYHDNLGLGAMVQQFGITPPAVNGVFKGYWEGDYLSRTEIGYYGLYILNTDDKSLAAHGQCFAVGPNGLLDDAAEVVPGTPPTCPPGQIHYYEGPTGFWISNPGTELLGNSIGGCQSTGKAYWYVPPTTQNWMDPSKNNFQMVNIPLGSVVNNRAHACYDGMFGEGEAGIAGVNQLQPKVDGDNNKQNLVAKFTGFTASRIRNRGVWMRPTWFVFEHARVATSREGVTLVTSGGLDGNAPGVWGLLKNSTIVGVSTNNVDRWGPCGGTSQEVEGPGCVDKNKDAATYVPKSYPSPAWNFAGFYIYDGPARIHDVRFVNFRVDPTDPKNQLLTDADVAIQKKFTGYFNSAKVYEGDAALGWFQNNQSAYPTATDVRGLKFDNTDLRHQVFTEKVNFGNFDDGDKNTAVIDRDGSLTGFKVVSGTGSPVADEYPISLNNLPFNAAINAVDECHATGAQDAAPGFGELRSTSLISPGNYGTLEFEAFMVAGQPGVVPPPPAPKEKQAKITQWMTFSKDLVDYKAHQTMDLHSRNNQGIWEPKVAHGHGYTVAVRTAVGSKGLDDAATTTPGIPNVISVGLNDIVKPNMSKTDPFYVRVGVCYTGAKAGHTRPNGKFKITRGYRSWGAGPVNFAEPKIRKLFVPIDGQNSYDREVCFNLSAQNPLNLNGFTFADPSTYKGCPAHGVVGRDTPDSTCPEGSKPELAGVTRQPICIYPKADDYVPVRSLADLTDPKTGKPVDLAKNNYFYDETTGMLFFYVMQDRPNVVFTSPLGACDVDSPPDYCPNPKGHPFPESYYACPAEGCLSYTVRLDDPDYEPAPSACTAPGKTIYETNPAYVQPPIQGANQLAFMGAGEGGRPAGAVVEALDRNATTEYPYRLAGWNGQPSEPECGGATPASVALSPFAKRVLGR